MELSGLGAGAGSGTGDRGNKGQDQQKQQSVEDAHGGRVHLHPREEQSQQL